MNDFLLASLLGAALLPSPDGSISVGDKLHLLGLASEPAAAPAPPPADTVAWVRGASDGRATTFPSQVGPFECEDGGTIFVSVRHFNWHLQKPSSVTDLAGNTYQLIASADAATFDGMQLWYATNIVGHPANVVTVHGTSVFWGVLADYYTGTVTLTGYVINQPPLSSDTTITSPAFDALPGLVYAVAQQSGTTAPWTPGAGYTLRTVTDSVEADHDNLMMSEDQTLAVTTLGHTASASNSRNGGKLMIVAFFEASTSDPETPVFPPLTVNPPPGDPVGAIYFARIVHTGDQVEQRGECTIRNPAELWGGKIPSGLLKVGKVSLRAVREGLPSAECTIELDDTPDPITGECFWRALSAEGPLEGAVIEVFRCHAPYGIILGTPWRYFAGRVPRGGHYPIEGFRYGFRFVDPLAELFDDPRFRVPIPKEPLTLAQFAGMLESFDGKVPPIILGNVVQDGEGVVRMIPMGRINILTAFGSGLNLEVGVGLIARQAVYDVVDGYYNILTWEASKPVFLGEERRPTIDNPGYGFIHRAQNAATTGAAEPQVANGNAWATTVGGTTPDGGVTWINAGIDDVTSRRRIPNEMYGVAGGLAVPHKPGWAAVTGAAPGNPNVPGEYVIYGAPNRAYTPVFWDLTHPYSPYVESGQIELLFDVVGAMTGATSGTPILNPVYQFIYLLLNYGWTQTDGLTYQAMPTIPGLTGDYNVFDMDTANAVKAAHDALGGMVNGFEVAYNGDPEDLWSVLNRIQKFGRFYTFKNRHGQIGFAVKDYTATPTLVFDEIRDQITVKERVSTDNRGIGVEFRYGKRYVPHVPAATAQPGQPVLAIGGRTKGEWASGLNYELHTAAETALATSKGRVVSEPITLDIDTTRDGPTAQLVAEFAKEEGAGPAPSYDGNRIFEFVGPFERVLLREGSDGKTLQPGACIAITNAEGMAASGYANKPAFVIEVEPDAETNRARVVVEILPDEAT